MFVLWNDGARDTKKTFYFHFFPIIWDSNDLINTFFPHINYNSLSYSFTAIHSISTDLRIA